MPSMQKDIVAITGDAVDVHDIACLITVGASAVHPYLALATALLQDGEETEHRYRHAVEHGLLKIMAKMGISCVASYCGANVIEVLGLGAEVMELCLPAVPSLIGGSSFEDLDAPVRRLTAPDVPIPFSPPLEQAVLPQLDDMKEACRELLAY